jgi:hypothetical protein
MPKKLLDFHKIVITCLIILITEDFVVFERGAPYGATRAATWRHTRAATWRHSCCNMAPLVLQHGAAHAARWRHSCCNMAPLMLLDMAPFMLLNMMPLMLQQGATYADIAAHGVIHVATNGVTHAAVLLMAPLILHCCHTWRHSGYDTTHGATHMPHMASLMLHCCHIGASHATTHGATHMPHRASLMLHCCNIGATLAATWILSVKSLCHS